MKAFAAHRLVLAAALAASTASGVFTPSDAAAQDASSVAPILIPVSGEFQTPEGEARTGTVLLVVSLYEGRTDLAPRWIEHQVVTLDAAGRYSIQFGGTRDEGLPSDLFTDAAATRWLGVAIENEPEQPRVPLVSVPYAAKAATADTLGGKTVTDFVLASTFMEDVRAALDGEDTRTASEGEPVGANQTVNEDLTVTGKLTVTGSGDSNFITSKGGFLTLGLRNTAAGSTDGTIFRVGNNVSDSVYEFQVYSSNYASQLYLFASGGALISTGAGGQSIVSNHPSGAIRFYSGGNAERMRLDPAGRLSVNGFGTHSFVSSGSGFNLMALRNTSAGAGNGTILRLGNDVTDSLYEFQAYSSNFSPQLYLFASGGALISNGAGGQSIVSSHASGAIRFYTGGATERARFDTSGNLGIGTTSPTAKLHVVGNTLITGNITVDGNIAAKYQDVAEWVDAAEPLEPGTVVVVDPDGRNRIMAASRAYDTRVAGAVSPQPGLVLGEPGPGRALVAQSGRVRIKVDATYAPIRAGDLLVSSPTKGHAMVSLPVQVGRQSVHRPGTLVGKALESLSSGRGEILVLLTLQ